MRAAYQQVRRNGGAPIDGMSVEERRYLAVEWQGIKEALLSDRYQPQPVKRVAKPGGGVRQLGIPTVVDRMVQQALHRVMAGSSSRGFRNRVMDSDLGVAKVAPESEHRLREKLKAEFRRARGRNLDRQMQELHRC